MACGGCAERGKAIIDAAVALAEGKADVAIDKAKFVATSAHEDASRAVRAAGARLSSMIGR